MERVDCACFRSRSRHRSRHRGRSPPPFPWRRLRAREARCPPRDDNLGPAVETPLVAPRRGRGPRLLFEKAAVPARLAREQLLRLTKHAGLAALAGVSLLAVVETASAIVAPYRAPTDADWRAAAGAIRAGFRSGDLIVSAPAWADSILRSHLGDLIPVEVAGRLDDERFARVWEVSQRGAHAPAAARGRVSEERRFGALTVRRIER